MGRYISVCRCGKNYISVATWCNCFCCKLIDPDTKYRFDTDAWGTLFDNYSTFS